MYYQKTLKEIRVNQSLRNDGKMFLGETQVTFTLCGKPHCSTLLHCIASSCLPEQLRWIIFNILN